MSLCASVKIVVDFACVEESKCGILLTPLIYQDDSFVAKESLRGQSPSRLPGRKRSVDRYDPEVLGH